MKRYILALIILTGFFGFLSILNVERAEAENQTFTRNLRVGMYGEDVYQLQVILNSDPQTSISGSGIGSKGNESRYFGQLTKEAVIRFQNKYLLEILLPNGLTYGTGVVGDSTRMILNRISVKGVATSSEQSSTKPRSETSLNQLIQSATSSNPNYKNLDGFLNEIQKIGTKNAIPSSMLDTIKSQVRKDAATSTDLRRAFLSKLKVKAVSEKNSGSLFAGIFEGAADSLDKIFSIPEAHAVTGVPFGGAILYTFFCTCSYNWMIWLTPLPPTEVALLSYEPFSQAFLSYNIPYTEWLLGNYVTTGGQCSIYYGYGCATIPTEGYITPVVGSSPD